MSEACTIKRFKRDAKPLKMIVGRDEGLYRHLTFKNPECFAYHYHISTWPGYLCFSGDMGCYVFSRLPDMFDFFRGDEINTGYWSEKLEAVDKNSGVRVFSKDKFAKVVMREAKGWEFSSSEEKRHSLRLLNDDWDGLIKTDFNNVSEAMGSLYTYKCEASGNTFKDVFEYDIEEYSFRFVWCCRAIIHAIKTYDKLKAKQDAKK